MVGRSVGRREEDGWATFEIWIPKREEEVSYYRTVPANGRGREEPHHQSECRGGARKKHFGINHHFERPEGKEGLPENTSIRECRDGVPVVVVDY